MKFCKLSLVLEDIYSVPLENENGIRPHLVFYIPANPVHSGRYVGVKEVSSYFCCCFIFWGMFYQLLHVPHTSSSTQSWGSVLPCIYC